MKSLKSLSLFSGCMGMDLGMELSGIEAIAFVDKDPACIETITQNRPNAIIFDDVFSNEMIAFAKKHRIDLVVGGPPCQSFSTIGKRRFLKDDRGRAMLGFVSVVKAVRPSFFALENVPGLVSADKGGILLQIQLEFESLGYCVAWGIYNSAAFGVPQSRKRLVMIGRKGKVPVDMLKSPVHYGVCTLRKAIEDLENNPGELLEFPKSIARVMPKIPEGGCWKSLPAKERKKAMGNANLASGGLTAFYRRLDYDKPCPTLLTSPVQRATTLCHPIKTRPLSVSEYKRVQCFPDDWKISGTIRDKYRQIGNAVPVLFGKAIGNAIVNMIN